MKVLITGVYGIVGSFLCNKLMDDNEVLGVGKREAYNECNKYYSCDITEYNNLEKILVENKDIDIIIHCAALAHNKGNDLSYDKFMMVNCQGTKNLIDLSNKYLNLKNFIFISTISVYGEKLEKSVYTEEDICEPKSPYAIAKLKSEDYIKERCKSNYSILRLAPVYSENFVLNIERRTSIRGIKYRVGSGKQKLSLCNIKNIYEAINYILKNVSKECNEIYNVADKKVYDFNDLLLAYKTRNKVIIPKCICMMVYEVNKMFLKNRFIDENTIKLVSNNIYSTGKIVNKLEMKYGLDNLTIGD